MAKIVKFQASQAQQIIQGVRAGLEKFQALKSRFRPKPAWVLLVHPDERYDAVDERVNVILSPAYYWYKHSPITLKNLRAARRVAPSIFSHGFPKEVTVFLPLKRKADLDLSPAIWTRLPRGWPPKGWQAQGSRGSILPRRRWRPNRRHCGSAPITPSRASGGRGLRFRCVMRPTRSVLTIRPGF